MGEKLGDAILIPDAGVYPQKLVSWGSLVFVSAIRSPLVLVEWLNKDIMVTHIVMKSRGNSELRKSFNSLWVNEERAYYFMIPSSDSSFTVEQNVTSNEVITTNMMMEYAFHRTCGIFWNELRAESLVVNSDGGMTAVFGCLCAYPFQVGDIKKMRSLK